MNRFLKGISLFTLLFVLALAIGDVLAAERPIVANQRKARQVPFQILDDNGISNASVSIGDAEMNITDSATGTYTLSWTKAFYRTPIIICADASTDAARHICETGTTTTSSATLRCFSAAAPGTLANFDIMDCLMSGWDAPENQ